MPRAAAVIRYDGKRGVTWKIKWADASGTQVKETLGAERDGWNQKKAEAELRERLVRVEQKSYRRPKPIMSRRTPGRGSSEARSGDAGSRAPSPSIARRSGAWSSTSGDTRSARFARAMLRRS